MRSLRFCALMLVLAGSFLLLGLVLMFLMPGILEFLLITAAHLLLAVAVPIVALVAIRPTALAVGLGVVWGAGWLLFHAGELAMLFFVLPPPWLSPVAQAGILAGGIGSGLAGLFAPRRAEVDSRVGERLVGAPFVLILAVVSSAFFWVPAAVSAIPQVSMWAHFPVALSMDVAAGLVTLSAGAYLWRRAPILQHAETSGSSGVEPLE